MRKSLLVCFAVILSGSFQDGPSAREDDPAVKVSAQNTFDFDHARLTPIAPRFNDETTRPLPYVLRVKHSGYFQVRFRRTDPRKFSYTITADDTQRPGAASLEVGDFVETRVADLTTVSVTMRHDQHFRRYRVVAALTQPSTTTGRVAPPAGLESVGLRATDVPKPPELEREQLAQREQTVDLYAISFDLWVETAPTWSLSYSGGIAFSSLTDDKFYLKTDTKGTPAATDDTKTVELDPDKNDFRPDIVAVANLHHPNARGIGMSFGVGLNNNADPRYFAGVSYVLGGNFILNTGWTGGKVRSLPAGQFLGEPPIAGDNTLQNLGSQFRHGFFIGIAFTTVNREKEFVGAFGSTTVVEPQPAAADIARDEFVGEYAIAGDETKVVKVEKSGTDDLKMTVPGQAPVTFVKANRKGNTWTAQIGDPKQTVTVAFKVENGKVVGLTYTRGTEKPVEAKKTSPKGV